MKKFGPALPSRYKLRVNETDSHDGWTDVETLETSWSQAEKAYLRLKAPRKALYDADTGAMLAFDDSRGWN